MRNIRVYLALLELEFRARITYRGDFFLSIFSALVQNGVLLAVLWVIFDRVDALGGWTAGQATFLYGVFSFTWGLTNLLFGHLRELPWQVRSGELDGLIVQPVSAYVQLLPYVGTEQLGHIITAAAVMVSAAPVAGVSWTPWLVLLLVIGIISGVGIFAGFLTILYSLGFWIPYPSLMQGLENVRDFAQYPMTIYPRWVRMLFSSVIPIGVAVYYPAGLVTGVEAVPWWYVLFGLPCAGLVGLAGMLVWRLGMRRYEGTGS